MLPWSDALKYGNNIFQNFPLSKIFIIPTLPIFIIERSLPIGSFLVFLLLFIGIAKNPRVSYFIRFNAMQALLLKLILIIFNYLEILFIQLSGSFFRLDILEIIIFISSLAIVIYASTQCIRGIEPDIPGISASAKMQI
ncbi:hypothetical protein EV11_0952 [Prochlorococcus sp. SS52]|nr:hypothetical protein EV04_1547 [Prochlorococcus marinus str. LG]KGG31906.1 hypothetical protein EV10_2005 [Prochlorococcus marinus str. SS51]KGG35929.1 hypothetical protein EV11_0952 [Prochlorococcus sp. SS52]